MSFRKISLLLAIAWMTLELYLSSQSSLPTPHIFSGQDKLLHAIYYAVLALLFLGSCNYSPPNYTSAQKAAAIFYAALYGAIDETHQYFTPGRHADLLDWLADLAGALLAILAASWAIKKFRLTRFIENN